VEAGLLAKCGANDAGVGVGTNALVSSLDRCEPGVPYHAILRRTLTSHTLAEAEDVVRTGPRSSSANYLLGSREGRVVDLETAPGGPDLAFTTEAPALVHTNHFTWPSPRPFKDIGRMGADDSIRRLTRARSAIAEGAVTVPSIQELLRDHGGHPASVCAHEEPGIDPAEDGATVASVVMDLSAGELWVSEGNPCEVSYERIRLADLLADARDTAGMRSPAVPERTA
jgi:isopenicillin-N N-acyltransferase like protein